MANKKTKAKATARPKVPELPKTQRAYTLRLRGVDPADTAWRDALWATHEAVNKGAKAFGDWLLTLRGGLSHELAEPPAPAKGKERSEEETASLRKNRRILLALSWLSVEDERSAPSGEVRVATGKDGEGQRKEKILAALRSILWKRGLNDTQIGEWVRDCAGSLGACIREDAVWVNRSAMFDAATTGWNTQDARKDAHTLLSFILSDEFLTLPTAKTPRKVSEAAENEDEQQERQKAVKASSRGAGQRTRHPFSHLLGEGRPFGRPQRKLVLRDQWHGYIKPKLEAIGIPVLDARSNNKGKRNDAAPAHTELQREMFSKAASRIAQIVTKQRQQEADRLARKEADAELRKMEADLSYNDALAAIRAYCDEYRVTSGATGEFMIRPRQVTGWDRVVKRWAAIKETDPDGAREARIDAVKETQEADEERKFGDANLFIRLADERYTSVWRMNDQADPTILERFVKGMKARSDSERLKVAAFRHPDPYFNPIFCQFGVSRPAIHFRRLKAFSDSPAGDDPRAVGMLLWHPKAKSARLTLMYGVSQRLDREIGSACDQVQQNAEELHSVSRRGRLGAAAAGLASADSPARVAGVFDPKRIKSRSADYDQADIGDEGEGNGKFKEPKWNGTLSTNRHNLAAIGKLFGKGDTQKATRRRDQLRWTLTVSMEMEGRGPWFRYVAAAQDQTPFVRKVRKDKPKDKNDLTKGTVERKGDKRIVAEGWPWQEFNKPLKDNREGTALVEDARAARGDKACLILSRLPCLRVLSVDLGHRFAAACAVWETLSADAMKREIAGRSIRAGGMGRDDPFCDVETPTRKIAKKGRNKGKPVTEITVYRRIGEDFLRDPRTGKPTDTPHPAPWARLDRQFLIKLQGEERPARAASPAELDFVHRFEDELGRIRDKHDPLPRRVDDLMAEAMRSLRLGLARHARRAKIAWAFDPETKTIPGMGGSETPFTPGDDTHVKLLTNALFDWHALATDRRWDDPESRDLWNQHIAPLTGAWKIEPQKPDPSESHERTRQQRQKDDEALRDRLRPIAQALANADRIAMHAAWRDRWLRGDGSPADRDAGTPVIGWHARLRQVSDWITGRCYPADESPSNGWKQNVGGLSLTRIATMRSLYQLHKAFAMRARPNKPRGAPEKGESNAGVAQSLLDAMERMREQRVKQLASRIVEAALGVGRMKPSKGRDRKHPQSRVDEPCHAIVIESLRHYRPDELRTRRENKALMTWSSGKVRKYLQEACQLYGLHLREVPANYTSRQCSRTGFPGLRCADVPVEEFLTAPWWNRIVGTARKKVEGGSTDAMARFLVELHDRWSASAENDRRGRTVRVPRDGGDLFVAASPWRDISRNGSDDRTARALQADLNAAANIGLRALLDPDLPGRWWYVLCDAATGKPVKDKYAGASCLDLTQRVLPPPERPRNAERTKSKRGGGDRVNAWRDVGAPGDWRVHAAYWNDVKARVVAVLRRVNGLPPLHDPAGALLEDAPARQ